MYDFLKYIGFETEEEFLIKTGTYYATFDISEHWKLEFFSLVRAVVLQVTYKGDNHRTLIDNSTINTAAELQLFMKNNVFLKQECPILHQKILEYRAPEILQP